MQTYYIIIFLPVTDWLSKIITELIILGWKVSPAASSKKPIDFGTLSGCIGLAAEFESTEFDTPLKVLGKVKEILNKNEISFFGIVIENNGKMAWAPSNTEHKKEPKTAYRD
jgi:hypothetical protein